MKRTPIFRRHKFAEKSDSGDEMGQKGGKSGKGALLHDHGFRRGDPLGPHEEEPSLKRMGEGLIGGPGFLVLLLLLPRPGEVFCVDGQPNLP